MAADIPPHEAFAAVGDETRIDILHTLWEHREESLSFSDLFEASALTDSGQFNYHLDRLRGHFIERTEEGYRLRNPGMDVVLSVLSNIVEDHPLTEPAVLEADCRGCGSPLELSFGDAWLSVECSSCPITYSGFPTPPAGLNGRTVSEIATMFDERVRRLSGLCHRGVCPLCAGQVETDARDASEKMPMPAAYRHSCLHCTGIVLTPLGMPLLEEPAVVSFCHRTGVDLRRPFWRIEWLFGDEHVSVESLEPLEATVTVPGAGERLLAHLDSSGVTSIERK